MKPANGSTPHIARKRFGQHFLTDQSVIDAIIACITPQAGQVMVEIGPGLAAMTQPLVERLGHLTVVELDRDLAARLRQHPQLQVIESDILKLQLPQLLQALNASSSPKDEQTSRLRIVGNLPYNISTPILFHLMEWVHVVQDQHFMLQKEVIDRMVALPSTSAYGRLSVMLQWRYEMENVLFVPPQAFDPPPRVDSAVVRMIPRLSPAPLNQALFQVLVQTAFSQRRKLLRHTLGQWLENRNVPHTFNLQRRAEEVPVREYIDLCLHVEQTDPPCATTTLA